jgi:hypothetical protein
MTSRIKTFTFISILVAIFQIVCAQSVVDELDENDEDLEIPSLVTETIQKISPSRRIFVISNNNNSFDKGDFISLVLNSKIVARALAAKTINDAAGIKILRINSLSLWKMLREGINVQIVRGDDSYFKAERKKQAKNKGQPKIESEEDLFNDTKILDDDLALDENKSRAIKTDNIVSASYGLIEGLDAAGNSKRYNQFMGQYAYQLADNIWAEALYGQNIIRGYPNENAGIDTKLTNFIARAKYTFPAPFYSYIQPYVGYQIIDADSPAAGTNPNNDPKLTTDELNEEVAKVRDLKKNRVVFGVTVLKRLVPGWFIRADLGSDIINFGFSLEF